MKMHKIYSQLKGFCVYKFANLGMSTDGKDVGSLGYDVAVGDWFGDGNQILYFYGDGIRHGGTRFTDDDFLVEESNA
jgi:hypothetical protein